ncbi:MAG: inositol monophosphatase [Acidobacteria bacterium]|nr:inositol monophosphatase [Acidobacteriota bacterium]
MLLATAVEGALACGRIHRQHFRQAPPVRKKGVVDLVTAADLAAEAHFTSLIAGRFPEHVVIGEEMGAALAPGRARCEWIIDPLDGTTNFAHGLAIFCVSIALQIDGAIEIGVVYDPIADELFTAERGGGARLNGRPIRVTGVTDLVDALLCTGFPYTVRNSPEEQVRAFAAFLGEAQAVRRLGSAALDLAYVAAGRLDGYWEEKLHAWDIAAGSLIVQEAGGTVTGGDGTAFQPFAGHIMASNGPLHQGMLDVFLRTRHGARP